MPISLVLPTAIGIEMGKVGPYDYGTLFENMHVYYLN